MLSARSLHAIVRGRVQGVGYRFYVLRRARDLGVNGFTRNLADGTVEVYAEGDEGSLAALVSALEQGPESAEVTGVDARYGAARRRIHGFYVR